ncbi:MAG: Ig-like domain-containing protein, partial [Gemmatimonadota bacterium]
MRRVLLVIAVLLGTSCNIERRPTDPESPVTQLLVRPETVMVDPLGSLQFQVYGRTSVGDSVPVSVRWSASAGAITSSGLFTADSLDDDVTITASLSSGSVSGDALARKLKVVKLIVSPDASTLRPGASQQFTTRGVRNTGDTVGVSSSYSATGGTISGSGVFTAGAVAGNYRVIASRRELGDTAAVSIVNAPVASVTVIPGTASLYVGRTAQLTATLKDSAGSVVTGRVIVWTSNAPSVASVSGNGVVTALAVGSATITATSEGQSGSAAVTVPVVPVASVVVTPASPTLRIGTTVQLNAATKDSAGNALTGRAVAWSSSTPGVATVSASGTVTAVAAGSATITASSEGKNGSSGVSVTAVPVASVTVAPATVSLRVGATAQLSATTKDSGGAVLPGRSVTWSSNATGVATVSSSGLVTAGSAGSATITATSEGKSGGAAITVTVVPVASVTVSPATANINVAATQQLTVVTKDSAGNVLSGRSVTWASNTVGVATVSAAGLVTAVAVGSAAITATSEGKSDTASITVTFVPVAAVTVSPSTASVNTGAFVQLTATLKDANGNTLTGRAVSWASGSTAIATV